LPKKEQENLLATESTELTEGNRKGLIAFLGVLGDLGGVEILRAVH